MSNLQKVDAQELAQVDNVSPMLAMIERAARDPNVDMDKMERLMAMKERMDAKQAETAFNAAMALAQADIGRIAADRENQQTHSWYATYAALDRVVRPVYTTHGFSLSFDTGDSPADVVRVLCHASHREGYTRTYKVDMPADGKGAKGGDVMTKTHAAGSAMQYGQRYLLKLIFNLAIGSDPVDDDGNSAGVPTITEDQEMLINDMLEATGSDRAKFLLWCKIERVSDIPAKSFNSVMATLKAKEKAK